MDIDETLEKIRALVVARVESSQDTWMHDKELLSLYLQLKMLDVLEEIYAEVLRLNPTYD